MEKFQNKYRIPSIRLQNWDYGAVGAYFVTICTKNREAFFGEIIQNEMQLNAIGQKTAEEWLKTIAIRQDMNLELGNFVVMPNHFHGIVIIGKNEFNSDLKMDSSVDSSVDSRGRDAMHRVSTDNNTNNNTNNNTVNNTYIIGNHNNNCKTIKTNKFGPQSKNLGSIIRGFKSAVTTYSKTVNINFGWQPRYHEHIIRNSLEFERIQNYIAHNIENWNKDKFYKK